MILNQVKRLYKRPFLSQSKRYVHDTKSPPGKTLHPLETRGLLKITGDDASVFLQGLITNDMRHFDNGTRSIYAMFLNNKGRVLYDTLIYKWESDKIFVIECDKKLQNLLLRHLKVFKLRRNIQIEDVNNEYRLWVLTSTAVHDLEDYDKPELSVFKDPRLSDLGYRIISSKEASQIAKAIGSDIDIKTNGDGYQYLRYKLGVSEGANDLPPATSFPLEANCDYLHGVSFHKGCYIGQEVTARVHHTGVIRKRFMPFRFLDPVDKTLETDSIITAKDNKKTNIGKLKGVINDYGLGLLRIKEAIESKTIIVNNYTAEVFKPSWWPLEAPKEIIKANETLESNEQTSAQ